MKRCFKCGDGKHISDFYKNAQMADGHLNKCKDCTKKDVRENRNKNVEKYREYDRVRGSRKNPEYYKEYRERFPNKYRARTLVNNTIRAGKLFREPCEVCGDVDHVHAHHDDYLKPLNVRWLCAAHHSQWHNKNGEGRNGE